MPGTSRSKISSDRFQEQSSATRPSRWTNSRSSRDSVRLLVGFKTTAEDGIRFKLRRLRTSRNFLSLADVHFLGSSCRNSYTMSFGTEGSRVSPEMSGRVRASCKILSALLMSYNCVFSNSWTFLSDEKLSRRTLGRPHQDFPKAALAVGLLVLKNPEPSSISCILLFAVLP